MNKIILRKNINDFCLRKEKFNYFTPENGKTTFITKYLNLFRIDLVSYPGLKFQSQLFNYKIYI